MRKFLSGGIAVLALAATSAAQAADLPSSATPTARAPRVAAVSTWDGLYIGGNIGYSWGTWDARGTGVSPTGSLSPSVDGWIGGLQAGYNWQPNAKWVFGIEGDFQWSGEKDDFRWIFPIVIGDARSGFTINETWKLLWLATLRARVGMLASPDTLIYGTGGLAVGRVNYRIGLSFGAASLALDESVTEWGWTIGAGVEKKINRDWSAKLEYLYVDLGSHTFFTNSTPVDMRDHILRVGINYKFNR